MGQHGPHPIPRQIHTPHPRPVVSDSPWWDVRSPGSPFNRLSACSKHWNCFLVTLHILSDSQALTEMSTLLFSMLAARKKGSRQGDTANRQITSLQIALHFLSISYLFPVKPNRIFLWFHPLATHPPIYLSMRPHLRGRQHHLNREARSFYPMGQVIMFVQEVDTLLQK